jgi:hypothetical protein
MVVMVAVSLEMLCGTTVGMVVVGTGTVTVETVTVEMVNHVTVETVSTVGLHVTVETVSCLVGTQVETSGLEQTHFETVGGTQVGVGAGGDQVGAVGDQVG